MDILKLFKPKKEFVDGKEIISVYCLDCTFSKKSCFRNWHWVDLTLKNGESVDVRSGKIIDFTRNKLQEVSSHSSPK